MVILFNTLKEWKNKNNDEQVQKNKSRESSNKRKEKH